MWFRKLKLLFYLLKVWFLHKGEYVIRVTQPAEDLDILSIYEVKCEKLIGLNDLENIKKYENISNSWIKLKNILELNLGLGKVIDIRLSPEYFKLRAINRKLFELVDEVKKEKELNSIGWQIDQNVFARHLAKKEIQNKYFEEKLKEEKIGYQ